MTSKRPNFVVFVPDQLRADCIGAFGNPHIQTPNIDALAARGARFDNAYVQHPVCSPSRVSFLTGWYPHVAGHRTLTNLLKGHEPNMLRELKESGYHVTWVGERGHALAPGVTETSVDEYGFRTKSQTPRFDRSIKVTPPPRDQDLWGRLFYKGLQNDPEFVDNDEAIIRTAEAWFEKLPEEPWLLFVPIMAPHCPFQVEEPWFSMYDRQQMPAPVPPEARVGREPAYAKALRESYGTGRATPEMWKEVVATYYGMISRMDHHFGRVMTALERSGQDNNTYTFFFADHGEFLGDHGLIEKWPSALDRSLTQDPLIIAGPGIAPGRVIDSMVEIIDVMTTVHDLADVTPARKHFGRSLTKVLADGSAGHREFAFTEGGFTVDEVHLLEVSPYPYDLKSQVQRDSPEFVGKAVAVRDEEWTYVYRLYEKPELYNRSADPSESVNLAGQAAVKDIEARFHHALVQWLLETGDVVPFEEDPHRPDVSLPIP